MRVEAGRFLDPLFAFWAMARPSQLLAVFLVSFTGAMMAHALYGSFDLWAVMPGYIPLLLVSISIHYANEYADYETDRLTRRTAFSGGSGVLPSGRLPRAWALYGAWFTLIVGMLAAIALVLLEQSSWMVVVILLVGAFGGWAYSLPPLRLAARGLGELDNAVLGGTLLPLHGYSLVTGQLNPGVLLASVPFTALVFVNLLATTYADREADALAQKRTLATRLPDTALRVIYATAAVLGIVSLLLLAGDFVPREMLFLSLPSVLLLGWGMLSYTRIHSPHPTVYAMIAMMLAQLVSWSVVCLRHIPGAAAALS